MTINRPFDCLIIEFVVARTYLKCTIYIGENPENGLDMVNAGIRLLQGDSLARGTVLE